MMPCAADATHPGRDRAGMDGRSCGKTIGAVSGGRRRERVDDRESFPAQDGYDAG